MSTVCYVVVMTVRSCPGHDKEANQVLNSEISDYDEDESDRSIER